MNTVSAKELHISYISYLSARELMIWLLSLHSMDFCIYKCTHTHVYGFIYILCMLCWDGLMDAGGLRETRSKKLLFCKSESCVCVVLCWDGSMDAGGMRETEI